MAAERIGLTDVKSGYDMYAECPYYALFETQSPNSTKTGRLLFSYKGGDREQGWLLLEQNLQVLESSAPTLRHIIQLYERLGKNDSLDDKTTYSGSILFRMKPAETYMPAINGVPQVAADNSFLNYLQTELRFSKEKIEELQDELDDANEQIRELEEEQSKPVGKEIGGIVGTIGEAGNQYPWLQDVIKDGITFLKHQFRNKPQHHEHREGHAMAGVDNDAPPDQRINAAIKQMVNWYIQEYSTSDMSDEQKQLAGFTKFADDMQLLAGLTHDSDMMHLALKKLRATAA